MTPVHALIDGRLSCGVPRSLTTPAVPARLAKFVTCKRCLRSLVIR